MPFANSEAFISLAGRMIAYRCHVTPRINPGFRLSTAQLDSTTNNKEERNLVECHLTYARQRAEEPTNL